MAAHGHGGGHGHAPAKGGGGGHGHSGHGHAPAKSGGGGHGHGGGHSASSHGGGGGGGGGSLTIDGLPRMILQIILVLIALGAFRDYAYEKYREYLGISEVEESAEDIPKTGALTPVSECITTEAAPCKMFVGYRQKIKTGGQPVLVKFHGKSAWFWLSGREEDRIPLGEFSPGDAEFASPDGTPVRVRIFPVE